MLRTNLASRPFYNDRLVRLGIALGVLLVAGLTAFNVFDVLSLNQRNREVDARVQSAEQLTAKFRQQAQAITGAIDEDEITAVQESAREANLLIERRVFSWTELFNRFEATLPPDVRITAVDPQVDREGRLLIAAAVVSRRVEALSEFMDRLEADGGFRDVIPRQQAVQEDGTYRSVVQGYYDPSAPPGSANGGEDVAGNASPDAAAPPPPEGATR